MADLINWIRCLVEWLRERDLSSPEPIPDKPAAKAIQLRGPYILVFCGPPCGGKSYLHDSFKKAHPELSSDGDEMDQVRLVKLPGPINDESARGAAYRLLHFYASRALNKRRPVTLNATYMPQRHRAELAALAVRSEVPIYIVQCVCSPEIVPEGIVPTLLIFTTFDKSGPADHARRNLH